MAELDINPELVARLVVGDDGHALDVLRIHPIDIDVYCVMLMSVQASERSI